MNFCKDPRAKGNSFVAHLDRKGLFSFGKMNPGWVVDKSMNNLHQSDWVFFECRNFQRFRTGMVAICFQSHEIYRNLPVDTRIPEFESGYLCIVIGYTIDEATKNVHVLILKRNGKTFSSHYDMSKCVSSMFSPKLVSLPCKDIRLIFLNQIGVSQFNLIGAYRASKIDKEDRSMQFSCKITPDRWCIPWDSLSTTERRSQMLTWSSPITRTGVTFSKNNSTIFKSRKLFRADTGKLMNDHVDTYYFDRKSLLQDLPSKKEKIFLMEYLIPSQLHSKIQHFAPLTLDQYKELTSWFRENQGPNGVIHYSLLNEKLDELLRSSSSNLIKVIGLTLSSPRHKIIVSLLDTDEEPPVSSMPIRGFDGGYIDEKRSKNYFDENVGAGIVVFRSYTWPFQNSISREMMSCLSECFSSHGLSRNGIVHRGTFQMLSHRQTNQASGSLLCSPGNTINHEYYREKDAKTNLLPIVRKISNQLTHESIDTGFASGEILMDLLMRACKDKRNRHSICPYGILTLNGFFNSIHPDNDFMSTKENDAVYKFLDSFEDRTNTVTKIKEYLSRVNAFCSKEVLPKSTTCCWTISYGCKTPCEDEIEFDMRQHFVSVNGGFAFNISSDVSDRLEQVGATFLASLFLHCTSIPFWVDRKTWNVSLECRNQKFNTAWGSSGGAADPDKPRKSSKRSRRPRRSHSKSRSTSKPTSRKRHLQGSTINTLGQKRHQYSTYGKRKKCAETTTSPSSSTYIENSSLNVENFGSIPNDSLKIFDQICNYGALQEEFDSFVLPGPIEDLLSNH